MNNLHRELAPVSEAAWTEIEEEAARTLKRHLAARQVVDMVGPAGLGLSAVGTGHVVPIAPPAEGVQSVRREVKALVELRMPFQLSRNAVDDVERGALDSDWSPVKEAMQKIAFAEDRAVFDGYAAAGIEGIRAAASNPAVPLPQGVKRYSDAVARAVGRLRLAGVEGLMRLCSAAMPTWPRAAAATTAIRSSTISSASSTAASSGRRPSRAASSCRCAAAISN